MKDKFKQALHRAPCWMAGAILICTFLYIALLTLPASLAAGSLADENIAASGEGWTIAANSATTSVSSTSSCDISQKSSEALILKNVSGSSASLSFSYSISNNGSLTITPPADCPLNDTGSSYLVTLPPDGEVSIVATSTKENTDPCEATLSNITLEYGNADVIFHAGTSGTFTVNAPDAQSLSLEQTYQYPAGTRFSLKATPEGGYKFAYWQVNGEGISNLATFNWVFGGSAGVTTVSPVFVREDVPTFSVGGRFFDSWDTAFNASTDTDPVILTSSGTLDAGNYTIENGQTLIIPYDSTYTKTVLVTTSGGKSTTPYTTLTVPTDASLVVNGTLLVHSKQGHSNTYNMGHPTGPYGQIVLAGSLVVNDGGVLNVRGYITGNGTVTAKSGASVHEIFQITDFRGGSASSQIYNKAFPFNQYYFQSIEGLLTLEPGASLYGGVMLYVSSKPQNTDIPVIGPDNTFLFQTDEDTTVQKYYDLATDRTSLTLDGIMTVNKLNIKVSIVTLSSNVPFPINGNMTLNILDGSIFRLNAKAKLLPGVEINIAKGGTFQITENGELYIYDAAGYKSSSIPAEGYSYQGYARPSFKYYTQLITRADTAIHLDGTLEVDGLFYSMPELIAVGNTGKLVLNATSAENTEIYEAFQSGKEYPTPLVTFSFPKGTLVGGEEPSTFENGLTYLANGGKWYNYTVSFKDGDTLVETRYFAKGQTLAVTSLPEYSSFTKDGYTPSGWSVTEDTAVTQDMVVTAAYTPNSYTVKFDPSGGTGTMGDQSFTYDAAQALTANAFKKDGYSFAGWSTTENGITAKYSDKESVSNLTAEQGGTVTLYAVWTEKATAGLAFAKAEITKGYGDAPFTNELTKATDATVTYTSGNESIATVDADGRATIVGLGDTTITATAVETGTHAAGSASYSLHVGKGTQSAPTGLTAQSCSAPGDTGSISGLTAAMEYKRSDSTGDYIPCPDGGSLTKLAAGTYLIRYAATELYEPGADATLVIAPYIEAEISRVTAANGSVTAVLKDAPTDIPAKENWTLVYHLSDSVSAYPLDVTAYQYDAGTRTAQFSFSPIPRAPQAQEVTVSVSISGSTQECSFTVDRQTTYTVQFDGNGGEGEMAEQSFYYDVVQRLSNNTYSLRNSVFAGWSTSRGGSVVYQDNAPVSRLEAIDGGIITLYAVWTNKALSGLTFQSREITVRYGEAAQANPLSKDTDAAAVYTSGNPAVATVDPDSGAITITGVGSAVITATVAETDDYASGAASYTLQVDKGLQGKPAGLTGHDSVDADSAGSITGVTADMEYKAPGSDRYLPCTGTALSGLSAGAYQIRFAETDLYCAGEPVTVTIRKTTTDNGGGGGGGGGAAVEEPAPTAPPATSGSSTVLEPESTVENGKASSTLDADTADKLVEQAAKSGSTEIVVKPAISTDDAGKVTQAVVELPASAVADMAEKTEAALKVETPVASITLPNESLASLAGTAGGSVAISAARQDDGAVKVELRAGGKAVDRLDGGLTVTLPVEDAAPGTVAMLVKTDGTTEVIKKSALLDGGLVVPLEGSATVKLADNSKTFSDVAPDDWYGGAVAFASAHELFSGTGDGSFDPGRPMDRGMLVTVLHRLENTPRGGTALFDDVAADAYYADAVAWAAENGIVTGSGSGFDPQGAVSREQLAVMLYRYASREGAGAAGSLDGFRDADAVSPWAADAMAWAVGAGLIQGDPSAGLNPGGSATRAEVAAILQRFITAAAQNKL